MSQTRGYCSNCERWKPIIRGSRPSICMSCNDTRVQSIRREAAIKTRNVAQARRDVEAAEKACVEWLREIDGAYDDAINNPCTCGSMDDTSCYGCAEWMKVQRKTRRLLDALDAARARLAEVERG